MRRYLSSVLLLAGLAACGDSPTSTSVPQEAAVTVSQKAVSLLVGQELTLTASVRSAGQQDVPGAAVEWESLNPGVATVTQAGVVRGVALGSAQIVARSSGRADTATVTVTSEVTRTFNVNSAVACDTGTYRAARQVASSQRALIFEDVTNPSGGFTAEEYQEIANSFDNLIWPVVTQNFGEPSDNDRNGR
jgi:ABC-type glycerol-3-phosphate transport system substrate-binding protein